MYSFQSSLRSSVFQPIDEGPPRPPSPSPLFPLFLWSGTYHHNNNTVFSSTSTLQSQLHVCFANSTRFGQLYALAANSVPWPPTLCSGGQLYALTANFML